MLYKSLSALLLLLGITLAAIITPFYLVIIALPVTIAALWIAYPRRYSLDVWVGFDKFMNACLGGDHRETVSSRLGKSVDHNSPTVFFTKSIDKLIYDCLGVIDEDHCSKSIDWSVGRRFK